MITFDSLTLFLTEFFIIEDFLSENILDLLTKHSVCFGAGIYSLTFLSTNT
jgi:hypothetical protein